MGAYLTQPITDKVSEDKTFKDMTYGASSMQGWRITQEDAHNCMTLFDEENDTSLFAVYDGHGGSEVAQYCALHLPEFLKQLPEYQGGDLETSSRLAFLRFDATLTEEAVIKELKVLAGDDDGGDEDEASAAPCVQSEADLLRAEANMPLDQLLSKYESLPPGLRQNEQFVSPVIHAKKSVFSNCEEKGEQDGVSSSDSCSTNGTNNSSVVLNLNDKLLTNGHADNENNLNKEKEIQNRLNCNSEEDNSRDVTQPQSRNDSEPSSSTDRIKSPVKKSLCEPVCSSTVGNSEDHFKSQDSQQSLSSSSASLSSHSRSVASSSSECVSKNSSSYNSIDSSLASTAESSTGVSQSGTSLCTSSSSSGEVKDTASSSQSSSLPGGSASREAESCLPSSSQPGNSGSSSSGTGSSGTCSGSITEPGSSGCSSSSSSSRGIILNIGDDDSDDDDDDDEYEDMDSDEEDDDDDGEEGDDDGEESIESPCMDMSNEEPGSGSGCTACLALLRGRKLIVANAGDSRCVISRGGGAVELSLDHKPEDEGERQRIEKAGGKVTADGRVNGGLNLSRAIGDHCYKRNSDLPAEEQMISASPDVQSVTLNEDDEFIVLACDGIWNYMSSQEVVDYILERLQSEEKRKKPSLICEELFDYCLAPNTFGDGTGCDNMTCIIIVLHPEKQPSLYKKRSAEDMDSSKSDEVQANKKVKTEVVLSESHTTDDNNTDSSDVVATETNPSEN